MSINFAYLVRGGPSWVQSRNLITFWLVPSGGGTARPITDGAMSARRPKWSPDASAIVFQGRADNQEQLDAVSLMTLHSAKGLEPSGVMYS